MDPELYKENPVYKHYRTNGKTHDWKCTGLTDWTERQKLWRCMRCGDEVLKEDHEDYLTLRSCAQVLMLEALT